jgi:hypothetical protein
MASFPGSESAGYVAPTAPQVAFLLGAGASVDAGVPAMAAMYDAFVGDLHPDDSAFVAGLMERASSWAGRRRRRERDVEILLASLERYGRLDDDLGLMLAGYAPPNNQDVGTRLAAVLRSKIRDFCLNVSRDRVGYLHALVRLANVYTTLDLFTLNYDVCVELAARDAGILCETGFGLEWEKGRLDYPGQQGAPRVRLHKLHGSVTWYQTPDFHYLHIPARTSHELVGIDGAALREMIVYPELEKDPDLSPYPDLLERFREAVTSAIVLVVVGYAFGDISLFRIMTEALSSNPRLQVLVVDPLSKADTLADWPLYRWLQLPLTFQVALATEQLQNAVQALITADAQQKMAYQALPMHPSNARTQFTQATWELLRIGHVPAARHLVHEVAAAIPSPPLSERELLVTDFRAWIDNAPDFDEPEAKAWWSIGRYHLIALEQGVLTRIAPSTTAPSNIEAQRFQQTHPGFGSGGGASSSNDVTSLEGAFERRFQAVKEDETARRQALARICAMIGQLREIIVLPEQGGANWGPQAGQLLLTYCQGTGLAAAADELLTTL